ncbi:uncharacterized protein [Ranitomeya imitator]|uniref:uncharacterized protein isoform X2 n=1 Tax=Ranitomeya imitator TaxID=111125 RepID=UPI0037E886BE
MDYKSRDTSWLSQISTIFGDNSDKTNDIVNSPDNCEADRQQLKDLLFKRMKTWWNSKTLEQYLQRRFIPRGLRVQVFPSFVVEDLTIVKKWEEACQSCSKTFLELLISLDQKKLEVIESQIRIIQDKLKEKMSIVELTAFEVDLDKSHAKWEQDLKKMKAQKFQRDQADYQQNKVYRWRRSQNQSRTNSIASISSTSSHISTETDTSMDLRRYNTRQATGGRDYNKYQESKQNSNFKRRNWKRSGY